MSDRREHWTREQFEDYYAKGDINRWLTMGRVSIECHEADCEDGEGWCHGWKMTRASNFADDIELYGNTPEEVRAAIAHNRFLLDHHNIDPASVYA